jgi:hypothetical protein
VGDADKRAKKVERLDVLAHLAAGDSIVHQRLHGPSELTLRTFIQLTHPPLRAYIRDAGRRVQISSQLGIRQAVCVGARWEEPGPTSA